VVDYLNLTEEQPFMPVFLEIKNEALWLEENNIKLPGNTQQKPSNEETSSRPPNSASVASKTTSPRPESALLSG